MHLSQSAISPPWLSIHRLYARLHALRPYLKWWFDFSNFLQKSVIFTLFLPLQVPYFYTYQFNDHTDRIHQKKTKRRNPFMKALIFQGWSIVVMLFQKLATEAHSFPSHICHQFYFIISSNGLLCRIFKIISCCSAVEFFAQLLANGFYCVTFHRKKWQKKQYMLVILQSWPKWRHDSALLRVFFLFLFISIFLITFH